MFSEKSTIIDGQGSKYATEYKSQRIIINELFASNDCPFSIIR